MRLVLVGPVYPYRGGIAHYTTMLFRALRELGHEVLLISFSRQYPGWLFPGSSDRDPSDATFEIPEAHFTVDSLNPLTWFRTFRLIRRFRPDRLILQWWSLYWAVPWATLGCLNRLFLRCPVVEICHNVTPHEAHWFDSLAVRLGLAWGDVYVVHSETEQADLLKLFRRAHTVVTSIPKYDHYSGSEVPRAQAREQLGLPEDALVLLFFGFVRPYKGLEDLLRALPLVKASHPTVRLLVAGEFWEEKDRCLQLIDLLGLQYSVIIDDRYVPNEEVGVVFSAVDVLVAPYRSVTGSAVVQLGRGFGLPIVTTRVGGMVELAAKNPQISLCNSSDPESLAKAIITSLDQCPRGRLELERLDDLNPDHVSEEWRALALRVLEVS